MKKNTVLKLTLGLFLVLNFIKPLQSQNAKPSIAVIDIDVRGHKMNGAQAIQFAINELMRINQYEVMDRYDIEYLSKRDTLSLSGCFSKICFSLTATSSRAKSF